MPFNAQDFRSHLSTNGGLAQNNHFEVILTTPKILNGDALASFTDKLTMRAHMVDMPARTLETLDRRYSGPMRNIPVGHTYTTLQLEFIETGDRKTRMFFDEWQEAMMRSTNGWDVPYYNDLICPTIELRLFNRYSSQISASYVFHECFPVSIGANQLAWETQNQGIMVPIEIAYYRWENSLVTPPVYRVFSNIFDESKEDTSLLGRLRTIHKQYKKVVKTVNQVKSTVQFYKNTAKEIKSVVKQIRNFKPNLGSLNGIAETLDRAGRIGERTIQTTDRATRPQPIFKSTNQRINVPASFRQVFN